MDKEKKDEEFLKKLKTMSVADLKQYESVAFLLNTAINLLGIFIILGALFNPAISIIIVCSILLYFLSATGVNTARFLAEIRKMIAAKDK